MFFFWLFFLKVIWVFSSCIEKKEQLNIVCRWCYCNWGFLNLVKANMFTIHIWDVILKLEEEGTILTRCKLFYVDSLSLFFFSPVMSKLSMNHLETLHKCISCRSEEFLRAWVKIMAIFLIRKSIPVFRCHSHWIVYTGYILCWLNYYF